MEDPVLSFAQKHILDEADIRFRFIGEKGASNLDMAEEGTARLDNLSVAREMEDAGKEPLSIKMATGWERGADGKWRYEVEDFEIDSKGLARRNRLWSNLPWGKEYDALSDKLFDGVELTEEESARFDDLSERAEELRDTYEANEVRYLDDYVKDEKLFKTYPELKQIRVEIYNAPTSNTGATYYGSQNLIRVNESVLDRADFRSILAHEVQHAVQSIEGFARGGNSVTYRSHLDALKEKRDAWFIIEEFANKRKELEEDASQMDVYDALVNEYHSDGFEFGDGFIPSRNAFDNGFNLWVRGYDKEGYEDAYNEYQSLIGKFGLGRENNRYNELSGEVEARNVQSRMNMTPEERRNTLASETEDVAREDQIILDVAKERTELAGYASSLSEQQGIPVSIINSQADISSDGIRRLVDKKADIRGWYDISSGRVCLYLPNAAGKADIQRTLLHEGVAHYGLRRLVGNENMDVFLDNVYAAASGKIRRNIRETALSQKMDIREATEEYLARLAEKDITPGFREKIRQFLTEILWALGFNIDIRDSELNYILARSKGNLQCPGTKKLPGFSEVRKNTLLITNKSFATGMTGTPMKITDYYKQVIQLYHLRRNPESITNIKNPTVKIQLAALKKNPDLIMNIDSPAEKAQFFVLRKDPKYIIYIKDPSEKAWLIAVSKDPTLIQFHKNPSEKIQLAAVMKEPSSIKFIDCQSEKVKLLAFQKEPSCRIYIDNPSEMVRMAIIKKYPGAIGEFKNISEKTGLLAVNTAPETIGLIDNPSVKIQLAATRKQPYCVCLINNLDCKAKAEACQFINSSDETKLEAVRYNPKNLQFINAPSDLIINTAFEETKKRELENSRMHGLAQLMENSTERVEQVDMGKAVSVSEISVADDHQLSKSSIRKYLERLSKNLPANFDSKHDETAFNKRYDFVKRGDEFEKSYFNSYQASYYTDNSSQGEKERETLAKDKEDFYNGRSQEIKEVMESDGLQQRVYSISNSNNEDYIHYMDKDGDILEFVYPQNREFGIRINGNPEGYAPIAPQDASNIHLAVQNYKYNRISLSQMEEKIDSVKQLYADSIKETNISTLNTDVNTAIDQKTSESALPPVKEMNIKGKRRELTVKDGTAMIRTNGQSYDATGILSVMQEQGIDIKTVPQKTMTDMLMGNKVSLPGSAPNTLFSIAKGPAGYTLKAFRIAKLANNIAAQEL